MLVAKKELFEKLIETIEIPWRVNNYLALEPLKHQILEEKSLERRMVQLLHLARLRGGISDLLEIVSQDIIDDEKFGYCVVNALAQLKDKCFQELMSK